MKKIGALSSCFLLFLVFVNAAGAAPITFTDTTLFTAIGTDPGIDLNGYGGQYIDKLEFVGDYVNWTHHFTFDPPAIDILNASLMLTFADDNCDNLWSLGMEWAFGYAEDGNWGFGEIDTGSYKYDVEVSYLYDGAFTITLIDLFGDFSLTNSDLTITYNSAAPVPEPATMLLFGTGIIGLATIGRKKLFVK